MSGRIPVAVLGATGVVGQRFLARLARHPRFEVVALAASERSSGKAYGAACAWRLPGEGYAGLAERRLVDCDPTAVDAPVVFSALDTGPASELEPRFAAAGALVFSNASAFRMAQDVPLLIPEVNPEHLGLVDVQRRARGWSGAILCNPNCTTTVMVMALAPLHAAFGVETVLMASMQAASGAGWPGVASLDLLGNVVPFSRGAEEKVEAETGKLLGRFQNGRVVPAPARVSASCQRVPVIDGHSEVVSVRLRGDPSPESVAEVLRDWRPEPQQLGLPSAPRAPIVVHTAEDRPQPRLDAEFEGGMAVHVGRIRRCGVLGIKFLALGHNVERGAAGGSILNAELAHARGLVGG
ncbi:MAG TPA: aspartate-semialdehyde dehydrogenase [Planctomycetota bacterium]|nr:aspartate-semialdehyde dehydrogenase [Planctomycetota bacterium]